VGLGRAQEAIQTLDRALLLANASGLKKEQADCQKAKGSALVQLGKYGEALEWYRLARQTYDQAGLNAEPEFKQQLIEALGDLGNLEVRLGDTASAEKDFRRAIEISEAIKHPRGVTINLIALGDLEWRRTNINRAIGTNLRFTDLQASLGLCQLRDIDARLERRRRSHATLRARLGSRLYAVPGSEAPLHNIVFTNQADALVSALKTAGITAARQYRTLSQHPAYRELAKSYVQAGKPADADLAQARLGWMARRWKKS
jgi:tetratricopeptide (TPR) repeat protein